MILSVYRKIFQNLFIYGNFSNSFCKLWRRANTECRKSFLKGYAAVCLEGVIIILACIIFSLFAASPPVIDSEAAAVTMVWKYIGELIFNMLVLVGTVKISDRLVREMLGL